jgi:hypothetical protein
MYLHKEFLEIKDFTLYKMINSKEEKEMIEETSEISKGLVIAREMASFVTNIMMSKGLADFWGMINTQ